MTDGFIEAGHGTRLYYRVAGEGSQTVIVPLECWTTELDAVARGRRIVYYDPRGRGQSSAVTELAALSYRQDLEDLDTVRRHLGLEKVALIGWSYFGGVVARYAMDHPERVERMVMIGALPARRQPYEEAMLATDAARRARVDPAVMQELMTPGADGAHQCAAMWKLFQATRMGRPPVRPLRKDPCQYPNEWPANFVPLWRRLDESLGDWDWRESAPQAMAPALVVHGLADSIPLAAAEEWARLLPGARLFTMDGVGHFPSLEDPELLCAALERFLGGDWPPAARSVAQP
ncbi:MAG TPA: alpha/beta hydrolase [Thermoanaerobaculia bacterium]|nr:alpha/beta hydrolase [Thermoanaerobaculia bacterium]